MPGRWRQNQWPRRPVSPKLKPETDPAVRDEARSVRRVIYRLFSGTAQGRLAGQDDLEWLNGGLAKAGRHRRFEH